MPRHSPCALVHLTVLLELYEFFVLVYPYTEKLQYRIVQFSRYKYAIWNRLVGLGGLEPPTSRLSGVRSNLLSYRPLFAYPHPIYGGDEEDRTPDLLRAKQALSQLSYTPMCYLENPAGLSKLNSVKVDFLRSS